MADSNEVNHDQISDITTTMNIMLIIIIIIIIITIKMKISHPIVHAARVMITTTLTITREIMIINTETAEGIAEWTVE